MEILDGSLPLFLLARDKPALVTIFCHHATSQSADAVGLGTVLVQVASAVKIRNSR